MRYPTNYTEYLKTKSAYKAQDLEPPLSFEDTWYTRWIIDAAWQDLRDYVSAREKLSVNWRSFEEICAMSAPEHCEQKWLDRLAATKQVLKKLKQDFDACSDVYLDQNLSVTEVGKERLHQAQNAIDSIAKMGMIFLEQYDEFVEGMGYPSMREHFCSSPYPEKTEILEYLRSGNIHIATAARIYDCFTQKLISGCGCLVHMNDQVYCWTNKLIYYIDAYHLRLPHYVESDILQKSRQKRADAAMP